MSVCTVGVVILLAREFAHGLLSPRGLGIALLIVCIGIGLWAVLIMRKTGAELILERKRAAQSLEGPAVTAIDLLRSKQRMFFIRLYKGVIALLVVALVTGLSKAKYFPWWATLVAVALNLGMTASFIWALRRLQKSDK